MDMVTITKEDLGVLFDLVVNSLDYGSGFLMTDEMQTLDRAAQVLGTTRVRCRDVLVPSVGKAARRGFCTLPIGHGGEHVYMGQAYDNLDAPAMRDPARRVWAVRYLSYSTVAQLSGVRAFPDMMY